MKNRVSYAYSYPRLEFERVYKIQKVKSLMEAVRFIEYCFAPERTSEPFVQLLELRETGGKISCAVVAEWITRYKIWLSPLKVANFEPVRIGEVLTHEVW